MDLQKSAKQSFVIKEASSFLPTKYGKFQISIYKSLLDNKEHAVLSIGNMQNQPVLTRIHSQCLTGDTLFSLKCDCGKQLQQSMQIIGKKGKGIILYLNQEGRGIGLANKIKTYTLQEKGLDTVEANHVLGFPADARNYDIATEILQDLGISTIALLTNSPDKLEQLTNKGIIIEKRIPLEISPNVINKYYLVTKKKKMGHTLGKV